MPRAGQARRLFLTKLFFSYPVVEKFIWNLELREVITNYKCDLCAYHLCYSPDGLFLAAAEHSDSSKKIRLWSTASPSDLRSTWVVALDVGAIYDLEFSPDNIQLFVKGVGRTVLLRRSDGTQLSAMQRDWQSSPSQRRASSGAARWAAVSSLLGSMMAAGVLQAASQRAA